MLLQKRQLIAATVLTLSVGVVIVAYPFVMSLSPSVVAGQSPGGLRIDIKDFEINSFKIITHRKSRKTTTSSSTSYHTGTASLVIRDENGKFYVYNLPIWEEQVVMPYKYWYQYEGFCKNFGPDIKTTNISSDTIIKCNDEEIESYFSDHWFWSLDGKNIDDYLPEMTDVPFIECGNELLLYRS